jgi:hypothetical protein
MSLKSRQFGLLLVMASALLLVAAGCSREEPPEEGAAPAGGPAAEPERQVGDHILRAPSDYVRTVTITAPRRIESGAQQALIQGEIKQFFAIEGRYPATLDELVEWRGEALPEPPKGYAYRYDPQKGTLQVVRER